MKKILIILIATFSFLGLFYYATTQLDKKALVDQRTIHGMEQAEKATKLEWVKAKKSKDQIDLEFAEVDEEMYLACIRIEKQRFHQESEAFDEERYSRCRQYLGEVYNTDLGYQIPVDLFYTYMKYDGVYISQTPQEHFKANGLLATDVATGGRPLDIYAPDINNEEKEYTISFLSYDDYPELGRAAILTSTDTLERWILGHVKSFTKEGSVVRTGEAFGITLCPGDEQSGTTTGCHAHIMYQTGVMQSKDKWFIPDFLEDHTQFINWSATEYRTERNYFKHDVWKESREEKQKEIENKGWYVKEGFEVFAGKTETKLAWDDQVYKEAGEAFDVGWRILSAIALREHRRSIENVTSSAGALGAMQFLPCTWFNWGADVTKPDGCYGKVNVENAFSGSYEHPRGYATDGDGDGIADINNYKDAIYSAAKYIKANVGKCGGVQCAILQYNHASWYVDQVMGFAYEMGLDFPTK